MRTAHCARRTADSGQRTADSGRRQAQRVCPRRPSTAARTRNASTRTYWLAAEAVGIGVGVVMLGVAPGSAFEFFIGAGEGVVIGVVVGVGIDWGGEGRSQAASTASDATAMHRRPTTRRWWANPFFESLPRMNGC